MLSHIHHKGGGYLSHVLFPLTTSSQFFSHQTKLQQVFNQPYLILANHISCPHHSSRMLPFFMNGDGFILSEDDLKRYNGHHQIDKYCFASGSDCPVIETVDSHHDIDIEQLKQWLRPTSISPDDVERWKTIPTLRILLIKTHNQFSGNPEEFSPKHRTIPGQTEITPLPRREEHIRMIREIFRHARLPLAALGAYIKSHITFLSAPTYEVFGDEGTSGGEVTKYYCSGTSWSIAWSYFHKTRHTSAVMFYREGDGCQRRSELESEILRLRQHITHPLLLAYIKTQISLCWTFKLLEEMNGQTFEIEKSVGLASWDWVLDREIAAYRDPNITDPDNEEQFARVQKKAVERYNVLSGKLINIRFRLRSFREQISWLRRMNNAYLISISQDPDYQPRSKECTELSTILDRMEDFTKVYTHDADTLMERLMQQMSSLSHLVTQRDSHISLAIADMNNEIAWQGKNTNNAMMAIAVASFVFLPGTFIASVFDTPIFNWQPAQNQTIVTEPFWIYWASCGLTTATLCACWFWYMKRKKVFEQARRKEARENFRRRILRTSSLMVTRSRSRSRRAGGGGGRMASLLGGGGDQVGSDRWRSRWMLWRVWNWLSGRRNVNGSGNMRRGDEERDLGGVVNIGLGAVKAASFDERL